MSREIVKGLCYKNGKVFTRQCSSNVYPKHFDSYENKRLTNRLEELGNIKDFEKELVFKNCLCWCIEWCKSDYKALERIRKTEDQLYETKDFRLAKEEIDKLDLKIMDVTYDKNLSEEEKEQRHKELIAEKTIWQNNISYMVDIAYEMIESDLN